MVGSKCYYSLPRLTSNQGGGNQYLKPIDKFGNSIYHKTWDEMRKNAHKLLTFGYVESSSKHNLFLRKHGKGIFFADMRGTEEVKIWEDPCPLVYYRFSEDVLDWEKRRIIKYELRRLRGGGCECRLSFYEEAEPGGLMFNCDEDGYCNHCGRDFQDNGLYCSDDCRTKDYTESLPECQVCREKMRRDSLIRHHISYDPEETILVCRPCHAKIHKAYRWMLKPPSGESQEYYQRKTEIGSKSRKEMYFDLFRMGVGIQEVTEKMGVKLETAQKWRRKWADVGGAKALEKELIVCENCGFEFNGILRTTCPKCRTFFIHQDSSDSPVDDQ